MKNSFFSAEYFDAYGSDVKRTCSYYEQIRWIEKYCNLKGADVLDYGCGIGEMMKILESGGSAVFGCDVSEHAINHCKANNLNSRMIINRRIPFKRKFDLIVLRGVFQHLVSPNDEVKNMYNHLKPGGYLAILSTPNIDSLCYRLFRDLPTITPEINQNLPSRTSVDHCLNLQGFRVLATRYPYLSSGYAQPITDFGKFILRFAKISSKVPTFPGNVFEVIGKKC